MRRDCGPAALDTRLKRCGLRLIFDINDLARRASQVHPRTRWPRSQLSARPPHYKTLLRLIYIIRAHSTDCYEHCN
jgi:hypothetical protein